jgi:hypothetical protein
VVHLLRKRVHCTFGLSSLLLSTRLRQLGHGRSNGSSGGSSGIGDRLVISPRGARNVGGRRSRLWGRDRNSWHDSAILLRGSSQRSRTDWSLQSFRYSGLGLDWRSGGVLSSWGCVTARRLVGKLVPDREF